MPEKVLITGGTGLVGHALTKLLLQKGYEVKYLSRKNSTLINNVESYQWDLKEGKLDPKAFEGTDYVIHLAGAGVADQKWSETRKKTILESRTKSTALLHQKLSEIPNQIKAVISATAIGIYGDTGSKIVEEDAQPGDDFLANVCVEWEKEVDKIGETGIRTVKIRIGVVLSPKGGALPQLVKPIQFFVGSPLGTGEQYMSWIHINDLCNLFIHAMENDKMQGAYNGVAPTPVTMSQMVHGIARTINRPVFPINVPAFVLKTIMGEMASIVLSGTRVSSKKTEETGFEFQFPQLFPALKNLFRKAG